MAKKQSDYLAGLLATDGAEPQTPSPSSEPDAKAETVKASSRAGLSLLGRESALARVASGEVRQVTQLSLDPTRVRVWKGNARVRSQLTPDNCRDLIDSIIAEGGQKVAAVVRRVSNDDRYDYEVVAGTRRHYAISWLRTHSYPDMKFLAVVADLDDEAAFRLADIENRARKDVSDIERARNYAAALDSHYEGHQTRMADRLKISKGWLSKMLRIAALPDDLLACFPDWQALPLNQAYQLAVKLDHKLTAPVIRANIEDVKERQRLAQAQDRDMLSVSDIMKRLLADRTDKQRSKFAPVTLKSQMGRPALTLQTVNRQGVTMRLHRGSGASDAELTRAFKDALKTLREQGREIS